MIFIRPEARRKRVPGRFCLRESKKSAFLPFVLDKDAKVGYDREDRQREALLSGNTPAFLDEKNSRKHLNLKVSGRGKKRFKRRKECGGDFK